ncbi:hypothetical protein R3P38DRAFT_2508022 [Favolaschia claudopus]|uniref:Integrase core domain-containing protein n=1 Tax=Favolaschia claudopus TaxID=2862362 RepID=A0AAW0D4D9_9AGAR
MVNHSGKNGTQNGERPPDDVLRESLHRYASLKLTVAQRLENLAVEHDYHIKKTKLKELNSQFDVPTVRKPPPLAVATTLIMDKLDEDINGANGPDAIKTFLAMDGQQIPRSTVRTVMKDNTPGSAKTRYPGNQDKIVRKNLTAIGVFQELHFDGHEKLCSAALEMGPVGISIYGGRDKGSSIAADLTVVPDARQAVVIGHWYLDFLEKFGYFPIQITVDGGSETGDMYAAHVALRQTHTADLDPIRWPPMVVLRSVNNIPIENSWKWLRKTNGRSLFEWIVDGKTNGLFNPGNQMHIHLFHWLWPKIVQKQLDSFQLYWNHRTPRKDEKKAMTSGVAPIEIYRNPELYGLKRLGRKVDQETIDRLREDLPYSREEAMRWVPDSFDDAAHEAYVTLCSPKLEPRRGWEIFGQMAELLVEWHNEDEIE